ncbi:GYF domain-containing protein [Flavobacterium sp.]|uniref:GYF domain-containing protein n=1 Tax=Flavobacterium sp. TaxID=239 RepID=UPI00286D09EF|nr:GYF domain-containing protein [Flavobacterium sp.]
MKKYFLHDGTQSSGPFDLEELKAKKITKSTPVWHEGLEKWKTAGEILALETIFVVVPPAFDTVPNSTIKLEKKGKKKRILGLSKNTFFVVLGVLVVSIFTIVSNVFQENRSDEFEIRNHKTEVGNYQYLQQQKEIEEQKTQLALQEQLEAERASKERKETINNRLLEIQTLLETNLNKLNDAKTKLEDANGFKILRTSEERNEQISALENDIDLFTTEIEKLKKESSLLKLELEKIK